MKGHVCNHLFLAILPILTALYIYSGQPGELNNIFHKTASDYGSRAGGRHIAVIGGGYAGLTAACELRRMGYNVTVYEKNDQSGGRAWVTTTEDGYQIEGGPSWYWMPDLFDSIFERYGRHQTEFYNLTRLDPAYRIYLPNDVIDVPGTMDGFMNWVDSVEPQSTENMNDFFDEASIIYKYGVYDWIWRPMVSITELFDIELVKAVFSMDIFSSLQNKIEQNVADPYIRDVLKWPVIFIGLSPEEAPVLYSMMTYAGHALGTWYPKPGGMQAPALALHRIATDMGVEIYLNEEVTQMRTEEDNITHICTENGCTHVDGVVAAADYHHVEQHLLPPQLRIYNSDYWQQRVLSPSCILFYLGINTRLPKLLHHTFFFETDLDKHLEHVFAHQGGFYDNFTFYVSTTSRTDEHVVPASASGEPAGEVLFLLVPISYAANHTDTPELRKQILSMAIRRMEDKMQVNIADNIAYEKHFGPRDFQKKFHAFRGNSFGLANTLLQSLMLKPSLDSLANNMVFAGHLAHPGPGVPPALVSGIVASNLLHSKINPQTTMFSRLLSSSKTPLTVLSILFLVGLLVHLLPHIYLSYHWHLWRSYVVCMGLLFKNGRTYFMAATLMGWQTFLDTAALYALFRVADDYVDSLEPAEKRSKDLEEFIEKFWKDKENKRGLYEHHVVLPAVINTVERIQYSDELFHLFFKSMRMDAKESNVCQTMEETIDYMKGSAAAIGDFMLPLLMPNNTEEERLAALPHARDLGNAFQLTNFFRDIGEDLEIHRQYVPQKMCEKYGVDLSKKDHEQPGFKDMMEELFKYNKVFYESADKGIAMLPPKINDLIRVSSVVYSGIEEEIRKRDYDVFSARTKVDFKKKLSIATSVISLPKLLWIICVELYFRGLNFIQRWMFPWSVLPCAYLMTSYLDLPDTTYAQFHLLYTLPCLIILILAAKAKTSWGFFMHTTMWSLVLCVVATSYTFFWDNYLIVNGVWTYHPERILAFIDKVPVEEVAFFSIQTLICCAAWILCVSRHGLVYPQLSSEDAASKSNTYTDCRPGEDHVHFVAQAHKAPSGKLLQNSLLLKITGNVIIWMMFVTGVVLFMCGGPRCFYLGLILMWALPILAFHWTLFSTALLCNVAVWLDCTAFCTTFLCMIDEWAMRSDCWSINVATSVPRIFGKHLPLEEVLFFVLTSFMCCWGLTLAMIAVTMPTTVTITDFKRHIKVSVVNLFTWSQKKTQSPYSATSTVTKTLATHHSKSGINIILR